MWDSKTDHLKPKTWECKVCNLKYTDLEKGYGWKCWQGHILTKIDNKRVDPDAKDSADHP